MLRAVDQSDHDFEQMYQECQNMAQVLRSIQSECAMVKDLNVVFVMDHSARAVDSLKDVQILLEATGLFGPREPNTNAKIEEVSNHPVSRLAKCKLRKELQEMARVKRLILVTKSPLATAVEEAVTFQGRHQSGQLKERIAAIVSIGNSDFATLCTAQSPEHNSASAQGFPLERSASYDNAKAMFSKFVRNEGALFPTGIPQELSKYTPRTGRSVSTERHPCVIAVGRSVPRCCCKGQNREQYNMGARFQMSWIPCPSDEERDCALWSIHCIIEKLRSEEFQSSWAGFRPMSNTTSKAPVPNLKAALRCRTLPETQLIFKAMECVGFAFRRLAVEELLLALNTNLEVSSGDRGLEACPARVRTGEQLMELCLGLLEINEANLVDFSKAGMRDLILSREFPRAAPAAGGVGHEMLAMVCLKHLHCLDRQTLLKPWISTNQWLLKDRRTCPLRGYATSFWDEHSRKAQPNCRYLPALLHQTILGNISTDDRRDPFYMPTTRGRTNVGLWLCTFYGFKPLVKTYLEMGADPNSRTFWPGTPLHAAVVKPDLEIVALLLERGGDPDSQNYLGITPLQLACAAGNEQLGHLLNQRATRIERNTRAGARPGEHYLCSNCHSLRDMPNARLPVAGMYLPECRYEYSKWLSPVEESREIRKTVAANTQRLDALSIREANPSDSVGQCPYRSERPASPQSEEWVVVEGDDVEMELF